MAETLHPGGFRRLPYLFTDQDGKPLPVKEAGRVVFRAHFAQKETTDAEGVNE